ATRDTLLAVAGTLSPAMKGPATQDFNTTRRSLYLMTIRSDRSGFGPLFDVADPTAPVDKRVTSTVAPQALFLLNHPFALEQARALAKRILDGPADTRQSIERTYVLVYGRPPTEKEAQIGLEFLQQTTAGASAAEPAWHEYCQVLLCANEFVY